MSVLPMSELRLETARLSMDELQAADRGLFVELFTDEETMKYIGPLLSARRIDRALRAAVRLNTVVPRQGLFLRVVENRSLQSIGLCSIQGLDPKRKRAEVGMMLGCAGRSRGLGTEALTALVSCAFRLFPIEEAWVQYRADHLAAEHLVMSAGFTPSVRVDADAGPADRCVWSAFRRSWGHQRLPIKSGEHTCRM